MLPSSHSGTGRWTCRSIALAATSGAGPRRVKGEPGVPAGDRPSIHDPRVHAPAPLEFGSETGPDLVHPETRFADRGDLEHRLCTDPDPGPHRKPHDVQPFDGD